MVTEDFGGVPLDTMILADRGWLTCAQLREGDRTLGYDLQRGRAEWAPITDVRRRTAAEVWRVGSNTWSAEVTPAHRWISETRIYRRPETLTSCPECGWVGKSVRSVSTHRGRMHSGALTKKRQSFDQLEFVRTQDLGGYEGHRLVLAAPANTVGRSGLSQQDVAVLGWLQGDGHYRQALDRPGAWDGAIYQSKPAMVDKLRALLAPVSHMEALRKPRASDSWPSYVFRLRRAYLTDLIQRSHMTSMTPEAWVLTLSSDQRAAWLTAIIDAEGSTYDGFVRITQVEGPLQDAIHLAVYLEGWRPTYSRLRAEERGSKASGNVGLARPRIAPAMWGPREVMGPRPVWCVQTELGSWTMRQGNRMMLTGAALT